MSNIDHLYAALVYVWSEIVGYKHIILGVSIATTISILKAIRDGKGHNWGEHLLCGIFAGIACTGLTILTWLIQSIFNVPSGMEIPSTFVVGIASGYIGIMGSREIIRDVRRASKKEKSDDSDSEQL